MPFWENVTRLSGNYATAQGERWRFASFSPRVIAVNYVDNPQVINLDTDTVFSDLAGSPPKARFVDVVRDFVMLGAINGHENRVHWSGLNNATFWTPGTQSCDFQDAVAGGPVKGVIGGAAAYVLQQQRVTRFTYVPGSTLVFQVDEVQGAKGIAGTNSLVKRGDEAFYLATDGFQRFSLVSGQQVPLGVNKWRRFFRDDMRAGTEENVLGGFDPVNPLILWAYISRDNSGNQCDRVLIYDTALDEASFADIGCEALCSWITGSLTLDTINSFGTLDTLPYSLDSPLWKNGTSTVGLFDHQHRLTYLHGASLAASVTTADGQVDRRTLINGTRPAVDASDVTVSIAMRERDADAVVYNAPEPMEDTGVAPAWASGNIARAKIQIPAGQNWTALKGIETQVRARGRR